MHACTYQYVWTVGKGLVLPMLAKLNLCQSSNKMLKKMHACTEKYNIFWTVGRALVLPLQN